MRLFFHWYLHSDNLPHSGLRSETEACDSLPLNLGLGWAEHTAGPNMGRGVNPTELMSRWDRRITVQVRGGGTGAREAGINIRLPLKKKRLVKSLRPSPGEFHKGPSPSSSMAATLRCWRNLRCCGNLLYSNVMVNIVRQIDHLIDVLFLTWLKTFHSQVNL